MVPCLSVSGGNITEEYPCTKFSFIAETVCMRGGKDGNNVSYYKYNEQDGNWAILDGLTTT